MFPLLPLRKVLEFSDPGQQDPIGWVLFAVCVLRVEERHRHGDALLPAAPAPGHCRRAHRHGGHSVSCGAGDHHVRSIRHPARASFASPAAVWLVSGTLSGEQGNKRGGRCPPSASTAFSTAFSTVSGADSRLPTPPCDVSHVESHRSYRLMSALLVVSHTFTITDGKDLRGFTRSAPRTV